MADDETTRLKAVAQQEEALFFFGMIWIINHAGALVQKGGLGFFE